MSSKDTERPSAGICSLCGRTLPDEPFEGTAGTFCSAGCFDVSTTLGANTTESDELATDHRDGSPDDGTDPSDPTSAGRERTFLRVDGLQTRTDEQYLERLATRVDGVHDAEASYVTETIRIDHDPGSVDEADLADRLSTLGYTASPRGDVGDIPGSAGTTRSASGGTHRRRGFDDTLDFRYAAGVLFGAFLMLPYVALLYPAHLSNLVDVGFLDQFAGSAFDGSAGLIVVRLYLLLTGVVLFFTGMPVLRGAYVALRMRRPNTDLLVAITVVGSYCYSVVAGVLGRGDVYFDLTVVVAAAVVAAMYYESLTKRRAMDMLTDVTVSRSSTARVYDADGTTSSVGVEELHSGDRILVRSGERIPVDGVLAEGECTVDESVVTGESLPVRKRAGEAVIGGSVVTHDAAVVTVDEDATSRIDRLVSAVWNIQSAEHGLQRRADALAGTVAPLVAGVAALVAVGTLVIGAGTATAALAFLGTLFVTAPWALGLATPVSVASSIAEAMERGIVVFDETVFERLRSVDVVVFDKTGTLTTGEMEVLTNDVPEDLLAATVALERRASHPAADAIVDAFGADGDPAAVPDGDNEPPARPDGASVTDDPGQADVSDFRSHANGVQGTVDGDDILVGNLALFENEGWTVDADVRKTVTDARESGHLPVVVGQEGAASGVVVLGDEPREDWQETVTRLGGRGTDVVILTGDDPAAAAAFESHPAVDYVFAGVPPEGKTAAITHLRQEGTVAMVGDGTNDAPALAEADLGITMGSATALASEAADVAIVEDDLSVVETAFALARSARGRVRQNVALALSFNVITIPLAVVGLLNPLFAMLAVLVTGGLVLANSSRSLLEE